MFQSTFHVMRAAVDRDKRLHTTYLSATVDLCRLSLLLSLTQVEQRWRCAGRRGWSAGSLRWPSSTLRCSRPWLTWSECWVPSTTSLDCSRLTLRSSMAASQPSRGMWRHCGQVWSSLQHRSIFNLSVTGGMLFLDASAICLFITMCVNKITWKRLGLQLLQRNFQSRSQ